MVRAVFLGGAITIQATSAVKPAAAPNARKGRIVPSLFVRKWRLKHRAVADSLMEIRAAGLAGSPYSRTIDANIDFDQRQPDGIVQNLPMINFAAYFRTNKVHR